MDLDLNFAILEILMAVLAVAVSVLAYEVHSRGTQVTVADIVAMKKEIDKVPVKAKTPQEKVQEYLTNLTGPHPVEAEVQTVVAAAPVTPALPAPAPSSKEEKPLSMEEIVNG